MELNDYFQIEPYSLERINKSKYLDKYFFELTQFHYENCPNYKNMLDALGYDHKHLCHYSEIPFLPTRLFKMLELYS